MTVADTMCYPLSKEIEECILELEQGEVDDQVTSEEEEEDELVDPSYLGAFWLCGGVGGELVLTMYTRCLLDELYIGRHVSPYWYNHGLNLIYED